jgi:hypothetical protein
MSIKVESEERRTRENEGYLAIVAKFQDTSYIHIGDYNRILQICKTDPDVWIITEAMKRYVDAKIKRAKAQDKADKIEMLNGLLNELAGDSNLVLMTRELEPEES